MENFGKAKTIATNLSCAASNADSAAMYTKFVYLYKIFKINSMAFTYNYIDTWY